MIELVFINHRFADLLLRGEIEDLPTIIGQFLQHTKALAEAFRVRRKEGIIKEQESWRTPEELLRQ
jgi:hypothetical protein